MSLAQNYMTCDFRILNCDLSLQGAIVLLADTSFGLIENADRQPIGIVTKAEIETAIAKGTPDLSHHISDMPVLQVGQSVEMQAIANSLFLKTLIQMNALVADETGEIVGILTKDGIQQFLRSRESQQKGLTLGELPSLGAERLAGQFRPLMAYYICRACRYRNALNTEQVQLVTSALPCQNPNVQPHDLKLN